MIVVWLNGFLHPFLAYEEKSSLMFARTAIGRRAGSLLEFVSAKRMPVIVQAEAAERGLACLAMIQGYYGYETDLPSLRRRFSISNHGVSHKALMDIATKIELTPRALKADPVDLDQIVLPCIVHWGLNHFVVLKKG